MALTKWTPTTDLMTLRRLGKTCEELGELVAVLGRTICQGLDGVDPATGEGNIERITKESADVIAQIGCNVGSSDCVVERGMTSQVHKTDYVVEESDLRTVARSSPDKAQWASVRRSNAWLPRPTK